MYQTIKLIINCGIVYHVLSLLITIKGKHMNDIKANTLINQNQVKYVQIRSRLWY